MLMGDARAAFEDDFGDAADKRAEPVLEYARGLAERLNRAIETTVAIGQYVRNILDRAEDFDTIMVGDRGANRCRVVRRFLIGNVTDTVAKRSLVPVIIVH